MIGKTIGQYEVQEELGSGGMAIVYLANDTRLNRKVVLKLLSPQHSNNPHFVSRFEREIKLLATLEHTAIVPMYGHGVYQNHPLPDRPFIVMRYMAGGSLSKRIAQGTMSPQKIQETIQRVATALHYAHQNGVIHRDLKPSNILFDDQDHAYLSDFGIAKLVEDHTSQYNAMTLTTNIMGTPAYMSPEQVRADQQLDRRSDIYSLGCVLFEMLTGKTPYQAPTTMSLSIKHISEPIPRLDLIIPKLSPAWQEIINKAMAKDRTERYQTALEFAEALKTISSLTPPADLPPEKRWRWIGRWGWIGIIVLFLLGMLALGAKFLPGILPVKFNAPTETPMPTPTFRILSTNTPLLTITSTPTATPTPSIQTSVKDGMVQLYVPAGNFIRGASSTDRLAEDDERPQQEIYLDPFWIDLYEVSNQQFALFVADTRYETLAEQEGGSDIFISISSKWSFVEGANWQHPQGPDSNLNGLDRHPVVQIAWADAASYCAWSGRRLPSEAEWEKAARGTTGQIYPWGNGFNGRLLNFCDVQCELPWASPNIDDGYQFTSPVGSYVSGASLYGALDMAGNVWEWVNDWYSASYYEQSPSRNPLGPDFGNYRILRGGSRVIDINNVRASYRYEVEPTLRLINTGFRCAQDGEGE